MAQPPPPPTTAEELRSEILVRYDSLSKRLRQIAHYVLDEPNAVALETLAVLSERIGVQPSAIVRFAKSFGFNGATQMQRLFRDGLLSGKTTLAYGERVREFAQSVEGKAVGDHAQVLVLHHLGYWWQSRHGRRRCSRLARGIEPPAANGRRA